MKPALWQLAAAVAQGSLLVRLVRQAPWIIVAAVLLANLAIRAAPDSAVAWLLRRWEWTVFDWRARFAADRLPPARPDDPKLGVVFLTEDCLSALRRETGAPWPWPRDFYAEVLRELTARGATSIGIDGLFYEPHWLSVLARQGAQGAWIQDGDATFAATLRELKNVTLAAGAHGRSNAAVRFPDPLFSTNAAAIGHVALLPDPDGVRRRLPVRQTGWDHGILRDVWHLGLVLGARLAQLDLDRAVLTNQTLLLPSPSRPDHPVRIPLDAGNNLIVNWELRHDAEPRLKTGRFASLLREHRARPAGEPPPRDWEGYTVLLCSTASGSNIEDRGPSPLLANDVGGSVIWNVAYAVATGRSIQRSSATTDTLVMVGLGLLTGVLSWRLRGGWASLAVAAIALAYLGVAVHVYTAYRWWIPIVQPVAGALAMTHLFMVSYRLLGEILLTRRDLAPYVVEVLWPHRLRHHPTRLHTATVFFADIRGFSEWLRRQCDDLAAWYRQHPIQGVSEAEFTSAAEEQLLALTNDYLVAVADCIQARQGTLDKFIGDCVMAFWGAPVRYERHAELALLAAIDAQRAVAARNAAHRVRPLVLPVRCPGRRAPVSVPLSQPVSLEFGVSVHCGVVSVGAVGDPRHLSNYTVFGRVVNETSRLQTAAGRGQIVCTEDVVNELRRVGSPWAAVCREPRSLTVTNRTLTVYQVDWSASAEAPSAGD